MRLYIYVTTASGKEMILAIGCIKCHQLSVYSPFLPINHSNEKCMNWRETTSYRLSGGNGFLQCTLCKYGFDPGSSCLIHGSVRFEVRSGNKVLLQNQEEEKVVEET